MTPRCCFRLQVAGHGAELHLSRDQMESVHLPLVRRLERGYRQARGAGGNRFVVLLAGPPGSGKSTLAAILEQIGAALRPPLPLQTLPMDGFHLSNAELQRRGLMTRKGLPYTYDLDALSASLAALKGGRPLRWPRYDRRIHDPVPGAILAAATGVMLVEGTFLALADRGWRELRTQAHLCLFLDCPLATLRPRVVARHRRGGRAEADAATHFARVDEVNTRRILSRRHGVDLTLVVQAGGGLRWAGEGTIRGRAGRRRRGCDAR